MSSHWTSEGRRTTFVRTPDPDLPERGESVAADQAMAEAAWNGRLAQHLEQTGGAVPAPGPGPLPRVSGMRSLGDVLLRRYR